MVDEHQISADFERLQEPGLCKRVKPGRRRLARYLATLNDGRDSTVRLLEENCQEARISASVGSVAVARFQH